MTIITFKIINNERWFEINRFGKVELFFYAPIGSGGFLQKLVFDYIKNSISIVQFSPYAPQDKIILEQTNVNEIYWQVEIEGELLDYEQFTGVKSINYIHDFYYRYHLNANSDNSQSQSPPVVEFGFTSPISIAEDGKLAVAAIFPPTTTTLKLFVNPTDTTNPSFDLNGNVSFDDLPNYLVKDYKINPENSNLEINLPGLSYDNGFKYKDLINLPFRIAFYNPDLSLWIYSNTVII